MSRLEAIERLQRMREKVMSKMPSPIFVVRVKEGKTRPRESKEGARSAATAALNMQAIDRAIGALVREEEANV